MVLSGRSEHGSTGVSPGGDHRSSRRGLGGISPPRGRAPGEANVVVGWRFPYLGGTERTRIEARSSAVEVVILHSVTGWSLTPKPGRRRGPGTPAVGTACRIPSHTNPNSRRDRSTNIETVVPVPGCTRTVHSADEPSPSVAHLMSTSFPSRGVTKKEVVSSEWTMPWPSVFAEVALGEDREAFFDQGFGRDLDVLDHQRHRGLTVGADDQRVRLDDVQLGL